METKTRRLLVIGIALTLVIGVVSSIGLPGLAGEYILEMPVVSEEVPTSTVTATPQLTVTNDTVQAVIASLSRQTQYYRELTLHVYYTGGDGEAVTTVRHWEDGNLAKTSLLLPDGQSQTGIREGDILHSWYQGDRSYYTRSTDAAGADFAQRIPHYEDVLTLPKSQIRESALVEERTVPCIFVEFFVEELNLTERYWVSLDTGLLFAAESLQGEQLVYRMEEQHYAKLTEAPTEFFLPDGRELHVIVAAEEAEDEDEAE